MKKVEIFTDGACKGNPGVGGFGIVLSYKGREKEVKKAFRQTTNNRMELLAVITALEMLKESCEVRLTSDSRYVTNAINKRWLNGWAKNGWRNSSNKTVPNKDLWIRLISLLDVHDVSFIWVKGHENCEGNLRCDGLANEAILEGNFEVDTGYSKALL